MYVQNASLCKNFFFTGIKTLVKTTVVNPGGCDLQILAWYTQFCGASTVKFVGHTTPPLFKAESWILQTVGLVNKIKSITQQYVTRHTYLNTVKEFCSKIKQSIFHRIIFLPPACLPFSATAFVSQIIWPFYVSGLRCYLLLHRLIHCLHAKYEETQKLRK